MKQMSWVVLSLAMLQGCQQDEGITPPAPLTVSTVTVTESVASQYRRFNGQVDAAELTPLAFRVEGELKQITVRTGQRVTQGQTLAVLDADKFDQQLRDAKVQFELATKQLQRGRELHSRNMVSNAELDELIANQRLTQVQYASAKARVGYTHLTAPFNGVVAEVPKEAFEAVTPGETVVSLYQDDRVYINIPVSDTVIAMINHKCVARLSADGVFWCRANRLSGVVPRAHQRVSTTKPDLPYVV
ncbi:probable Co/Zn/Cd efflux system membrane fusion protein [Photobacterium aphoticum]|uniref:Probable Co/Zn/Cd efflux system membrane fusion protein n=1 Tax=Photobacterium aphoticum TaxID=754436 RepID=A0A090R9Z2_9GAMM|nr:probable Co/Zn/Cd efflux system membrane fusion protein [Photobacterium aphoticum]